MEIRVRTMQEQIWIKVKGNIKIERTIEKHLSREGRND